MAIETLFKNNNCEWIDLEAPDHQSLKLLEEQYNINWFLLEDTIDKDHLPKFEEVNGVKFYLTRENTDLERSTLNGISDVSTKLGIFIKDRVIITVHRMRNKSIADTVTDLNALLDSQHITVDDIALRLAHRVIKTFHTECDNLTDLLDKIENEIFLKNTSDSNQIRRLYRLKRKAGLNTRLLNMTTPWITEYKKLNLKDVEVADLQDQHRDALSDFDHLNAQINNLISMFLALSDQKANQVMKLLTKYSIYFLPITFIAGLYGMNFDVMPELHHKKGYYYTLGLMGAVVLFTFIYMRRKKM